MKKLLLAAVALSCLSADEIFDHSNLDKTASACIVVRSSLAGKGKSLVTVVNECGVNFRLVWVHMKYLDSQGFRVGMDEEDVGVYIRSFLIRDKVKRIVDMPDFAVRAQVRDMEAYR